MPDDPVTELFNFRAKPEQWQLDICLALVPTALVETERLVAAGMERELATETAVVRCLTLTIRLLQRLGVT